MVQIIGEKKDTVQITGEDIAQLQPIERAISFIINQLGHIEYQLSSLKNQKKDILLHIHNKQVEFNKELKHIQK